MLVTSVSVGWLMGWLLTGLLLSGRTWSLGFRVRIDSHEGCDSSHLLNDMVPIQPVVLTVRVRVRVRRQGYKVLTVSVLGLGLEGRVRRSSL